MSKLIFYFIAFFLIADNIFAQKNSKVGSLEEYENFLLRLKADTNIIFVPQKDFAKTNDSTKIIVSIRHDVDVDIQNAIRMANFEASIGVPATYYILHSAKYYRTKDDIHHNDTILPYIELLQCLGHEVAWHNNLLTLQIVYAISPKEYLAEELQWLRSNGINIYGTVAHGDPLCHKYGYLNSYFFYEYKDHISPQFPNYDSIVKDDGTVVYFEKAHLSDFDFKYQCHLLHYNEYFSDGSGREIINTDISKWKPGEKYIFNFHPIHWPPEKLDQNSKDSIVIFPNPNNGNFFIKLQNNTFLLDVKIYDLAGKPVFQYNKCSASELQLNTNLKPGVYVIKISYNTLDSIKAATKKLVITGF